MEKLIFNRIQKYDPKLKDFEISYSNHPLILNDLITLYKGRNKLAKDENMKKLTLQILNDLIFIKNNKSVEYIKFVVVKKDTINRLFFFNEDYSIIFSDYIVPHE